ncbi:hypothetical protein MMYC01_200042 [Madurella mycetomatis]|uniref:Uncharacterized protein n=1 Tax=Madurella mycetomatis TaxID=100816 RepID=A0A150ASL1_9PEZI|nr:hypothetical protein MMYC01_200042 [Madurella mycetomatis]
MVLSRPTYVVLSWRLTPDEYPVFETRHVITLQTDDADKNGVVFSSDLAWARTIVRNNQAFTERARQRRAAARGARKTPRQLRHQQYYHHITKCHQFHLRRQACRCVFCGHSASQSWQPRVRPERGDAKWRHHSQWWLETFPRYAEQVFAKTGDTAELLRLVQWLDRLANCRVHHQKQARKQG